MRPDPSGGDTTHQGLQQATRPLRLSPDGLVGHGQLAQLDGLRQIVLHLVALAHLFPHGCAVGAEGASLALGDEQGLLGIAQELVAVAAVIGDRG